jgi:hypothetical protein
MYLLAQYFLRTNAHGGRIELEGLGNIYDDMNILNKALASRLQYATQSDSVKNAIALLDMYSTLVPLLVDDQLAELRGFFQAYFPHIELEQVTTNYIAEAKNLTLELESIEAEDKTQTEPAWMQAAKRDSANKDAGGLAEGEQAQDHELSAADKILQGSSLSLSLDPLSDN